MAFYKTRIVYEVLSEVPLEDEDLDSIFRNCMLGDYSGHCFERVEAELTRDELIEACAEHGTDPNFFFGEGVS